MSDLRDMFTLENLNMSVVRNRTEIGMNVSTVATSRRSDRVVWFSEAQLKPPHFPLSLRARKLYSQIFVTSWRSGSPAEMYNLSVHHFITNVNGVATEDLDSFTNEIKKLAGNSYCQINLVSLQGVTRTGETSRPSTLGGRRSLKLGSSRSFDGIQSIGVRPRSFGFRR